MSPQPEDSTGPSKRKAGLASPSPELCQILAHGWPNSVNAILSFLPGLAMLHFLGSNAEHVAGAGMGFMFSNVAGFSLIIGTGAGAQPLISQAFGAGNFPRCGELLQRQIAIHAVLVVFIAAIWLSAERILLFFRQPADIAALSGQFLRWRVAALPALALKEDLSNYLVAQRVMKFPMFASIAAGILNVVGFVVLIPKMGFVGAPLAYTLANLLQASFLCITSKFMLPERSAWPQFAWSTAMQAWGEILKLALPGGVLMLCEWWGWEMNLFFAGLLCSNDSGTSCLPLDVFPIVANTMVIAFMPNYGFSIAAGALMGNALGANDAAKARRLANIALIIAALVGGGIAVMLFFARWWWGQMFSDDAGVVDLTAQVLPTVAGYIFLDCLGPGALVNILRSMNVVTLPAMINFVAFYVIGIPVGLLLTFKLHWGITGLWSGLVLGMFVMVSSLLVFLFFYVDWEQVCESAQAGAQGECSNVKASREQSQERVSLKANVELEKGQEDKYPSRNTLGKASCEAIDFDEGNLVMPST